MNPYDIQISPHFNLQEYAVSREFPHLIQNSGFFTEKDIRKIHGFCWYVGEPLREHFDPEGKKGGVRVSSGKRPKALNDAVGGSSTSDHLYIGESGAVDIVVAAAHTIKVGQWIIENCLVKKVIVYPERGFTHVSFVDDLSQTKQFFCYRKATGYIPF